MSASSHIFFIFLLVIVAALYFDQVSGEEIIFNDDFNRSNSGTVGNGWTEYEPSADSNIRISSQQLEMKGKNDKFEPCVVNTLTTPSSTANNSTLKWSFLYDFEYMDVDKYSMYFDIGNGLTCDGTKSPGNEVIRLEQVATNVETDPQDWMWYTTTGSKTAVAKINGTTTIEAILYQDTSTLDLSFTGAGFFDGAQVTTDIPFNNATEIDTIRILLSRLTETDWNTKFVDDIVMTNYVSCGIAVPSALDFGALIANGHTKTDEVSLEISSTGTMASSVSVYATNWLTVAADETMMNGNETRFGFIQGEAYESKSWLNDTSTLKFFADIDGDGNTSYWQAQPEALDELFVGDVYQNMTFVATC